MDDCLITKWSDHDYYLVTNAARKEVDLNWINSVKKDFLNQSDLNQVEFNSLEDQGWGLLALQGPKASKILQGLLDDQSFKLDQSLFFGQSVHLNLRGGVKVHLARSGYTGEDGFEISIEPKYAQSTAELLLSQPELSWIGLAARDSLRLEAGMCLYGQDLDETVGVGEAGLSWLVGKDRTGFIGEERTLAEKGELIKRRRVGLIIEDGPPGRPGAKILNPETQTEIGIITSGIPSPSLSKNIAMGYVQSGHHSPNTELIVLVRGKPRKAKVVKMPFVEHKFFKA